MNPLAWTEEKELETGVVVAYWVLDRMLVNMKNGKAVVSFEGYLDQQAFCDGKSKILEKSVEIDFAAFDPNGQITAGVIAMVQAAEGA